MGTQKTEKPSVPTLVKAVGGLMDKDFVYTRSEATDIRKTFAKIRGQLIPGTSIHTLNKRGN